MTSHNISGEGIDLEAIQTREQAAAVGPWNARQEPYHGSTLTDVMGPFGSNEIASIDGLCDPDEAFATAVFIAHARQDIPALLAEVRELRAALIRLRGAQQEETAHEDLSRTESLSQVIRMGISA